MAESWFDMQNFFEGKRVLITGHTGFKGAWLAQILYLWGAQVVGVSLKPITKPNLFSVLGLNKRIKNHFVDIRDFKKINSIFKRQKPEIVIHLAAQALVRRSYDEPYLTHSTNVLGTINILEAIRMSDSVRAAVVITTDKVYIPDAARPCLEKDTLGATDPYGSSKAAADILTQSYIDSFFNKSKKFVAIARAGNVIGGGDWSEDRLMVDFVRSIYERGYRCVIRNPESIRPWQHVFEPLTGYLELSRRLYNADMSAVGAWNFGPDKESHVSVKSILQKAIDITGIGAYNIVKDESKIETGILRLDNNKVKRELSWHPKMTVDQTLRLTLSWYDYFYKKSGDIIKFSNKQIKDFYEM